MPFLYSAKIASFAHGTLPRSSKISALLSDVFCSDMSRFVFRIAPFPDFPPPVPEGDFVPPLMALFMAFTQSSIVAYDFPAIALSAAYVFESEKYASAPSNKDLYFTSN